MFRHISEELRKLEKLFTPRINCELVWDKDFSVWWCVEYGKNKYQTRYLGVGNTTEDAIKTFELDSRRKPIIINAQRTVEEYEEKLKS